MGIWRRVGNLFWRVKVGREIDEEISAHLALRAEDNVAAGMPEREARREARVRFGNPVAMRERTMAADAALLLESIWADVRYACRGLLRNRGFAATAIAVLGLGIGAAVALFAFVDAALIKPMPYADPTRLVSLYETVPSCLLCNVSYLNFRDWQRDARSFQSIEVWGYARYAVHANGGIEPTDGTRVSDGFFRTQIPSSYRLLASNKVTFKVGPYNHTQPLIIDPVLTYSTYFDGSGSDSVAAVVTDSGGNAYLTGSTTSSNFPTTAGAFSTTYGSGSAIFIGKLNAAGSALVYSTFLVSTGYNSGLGIAVDSLGSAYVTGGVAGPTNTFPTTPAAYKTTTTLSSNIFVTKLSPGGDKLIYSTYLGGADGGAAGNAIAVDSGGNAYVTGSLGDYFPTLATTPGAFQPNFPQSASSCAFVTKLDPTGSKLVYSTFLGGDDVYATNSGNAIQVDSDGDAFVAGATDSGSFPVTPGAFQTGKNDGYYLAGFVSKLNPGGTALLYSTFLRGDQDTVVTALYIDSLGDAYLSGNTYSISFPLSPGAVQTVNPSTNGPSGFVSKLNPQGSKLLLSTYLGGNLSTYPAAVAADPDGNVYASGSTESINFPVTQGALQTSMGGFDNSTVAPASGGGFFTKLSPNGSSLVYSTYLGGSPSGEAVDNLGNVILAGRTFGNLVTTPNAFQSAATTVPGIFVMQLATGTGAGPRTGTRIDLTTPGPAYLGQTTTITGTVIPTGLTATPTGALTFQTSNGNSTVTLDANGKATYTTGPLPVGGFPIVATYEGSSTYDPSNAYFILPVSYNDSVTLTANPPKVIAGTPIVFIATVKGLTSSATPTGTITFTCNFQPGVVVPLNASGQASYTIPTGPVPVGQILNDETCYAAYSGDSNFQANPYIGPAFGEAFAAVLYVNSGGSQLTAYGKSFHAPLVLKALNFDYQPLAGQPITFSGVGLTFSPTSTVSGADGTFQTTVTPTSAGSFSASISTASGGTPLSVPFRAGDALLDLTSTPFSVKYGSPIPPLTYNLAGFVNGDTAATSGITGAPHLSTDATSTSPAGVYPIHVGTGTLSAPNYFFGAHNSYLLIHTAPLQLTADSFTIHKGDPIPSLTYTITGFVLGQTAASTVTGAPILKTITNTNQLGHFAIYIHYGSLTAPNYYFVQGPGVLNIVP